MLRKYLLTPLFETPNAGSGGGASGAGTSGNSAAPASSGSSASGSGSSSGSTGNITSGTASEALIKAAMASSSDATGTSTGNAGDTSGATGAAGAGAAGAIAQTPPAGQAAPPAAAGAAGAPDNRIQVAVRNARAAVLQSFGLDPNMDTRSPEFQGRVQSMQRAMRLAEHLSTPEGIRSFYNRLRTELEGARTGGDQGDPNENLALPDADLQSQDGKVKAYSAEALQKALDVHGKMVQRSVMKQLQPMLDEVNGIREGRQSREQMERTSQVLSKATAHARTLPHFKDNEANVVKALQSMDPNLKREIGPIAAMYMAYGQVLAKAVFPTLESNVEKRLRETFQREANANRGNVPVGGASGASSKKVELSGPDSLARHMEHLAATMGS